MPFLPQAMDYPRECAAICPDKALGRRTDQLIQDGQHIEVGKLETCKVVEMIARSTRQYRSIYILQISRRRLL